MDNWAIAYLSLEAIIMVSLFGFMVVLFCLGSIFNNGKRDNKNKKQPYVSRRQKLKEYNKKEREHR
jgi:hypothetical protein